MGQHSAVQVLPSAPPTLTDLPDNAEVIRTTTSVFWLRNWDRAIDLGAPSTQTDTPALDCERFFRAPSEAPRHVEVLLVSFGDKFMATERLRRWALKNRLYKFIHPRVVLALGEEMVSVFSSRILRGGRVGIVSLEPVVSLEGDPDKRVCTLYWRRDKYGEIRGELILDRYGYGWSSDHFIGFDVTRRVP